MADDAQHPASESDLPFEERRKRQRRHADRTGKYDRRRNRCLHCSFFSDAPGYCGYLEKPMSAEDFACPAFEPATGSR